MIVFFVCLDICDELCHDLSRDMKAIVSQRHAYFMIEFFFACLDICEELCVLFVCFSQPQADCSFLVCLDICDELCHDLSKDMKAKAIVGLAVTLTIHQCCGSGIQDPGSGAFLPPRSGIGIRDEFFPDPGSKGYHSMFFGEIFLRILVL
jgi:hypothetical protein